MPEIQGACQCGSVSFSAWLPSPPESYTPRACDCEFCCRHGVAYCSDAEGSLHFREHPGLVRQRQSPEGVAEFLLCRHCQTLVGVVYVEAGRCYGAFNANAAQARFGASQSVSPQRLEPEQRRQRWKELWFRDVRFL